MRSWSHHRQAALSGMVAVVLLVIGNLLFGQPPKFVTSASTVTHFFTQHHKTVLVGMLLTGLAIPFYVWFIAHLALAIRGPLGASVALGGILVAAAATVGDGLTVTVAHAAKADTATGAVQVVYQASVIAYGRLLWAAIAVAVAVALAAKHGALRPWIAPVMWAQAVLMLIGGASLKSSGFFSPTGGMALVAFLAYFIGTFAIAFAMWQSEPRAAEAPTMATTAA